MDEVTDFSGPDCGIDYCVREVGHIGDHRPDPREGEGEADTCPTCGLTYCLGRFQDMDCDHAEVVAP